MKNKKRLVTYLVDDKYLDEMTKLSKTTLFSKSRIIELLIESSTITKLKRMTTKHTKKKQK